MRYDDARNLVYFGWDATGTFNGQSGDFVNLSISKDRGLTWQMCVADFVPGEVPGFVTADHDSAGNIYIGYGDSGAFHTYMKSITRQQLEKCDAAGGHDDGRRGGDAARRRDAFGPAHPGRP